MRNDPITGHINPDGSREGDWVASTMTRNEAAERLVEFIVDSPYSATVRDGYLRDLDAALATERRHATRATVERMVDLTSEYIEQGLHALDAHHKAARSILDDLATADVDEEECPVCEGWGAYCDKHKPEPQP